MPDHGARTYHTSRDAGSPPRICMHLHLLRHDYKPPGYCAVLSEAHADRSLTGTAPQWHRASTGGRTDTTERSLRCCLQQKRILSASDEEMAWRYGFEHGAGARLAYLLVTTSTHGKASARVRRDGRLTTKSQFLQYGTFQQQHLRCCSNVAACPSPPAAALAPAPTPPLRLVVVMLRLRG